MCVRVYLYPYASRHVNNRAKATPDALRLWGTVGFCCSGTQKRIAIYIYLSRNTYQTTKYLNYCKSYIMHE